MKVKFLPQNVEVEIKPNESVLTVAQDNGLHIQSVCKGIPSCAECRVYIKEGEANVVPPLQPELELIGTAYFIDHRRLSCQLRCFGDVVVDLTEQIEKQHKSTKNPQGRYVKEKEDSKARMGNILEELGEVEVPKELLEGLEPEDLEPIAPKAPTSNQNNNHNRQNQHNRNNQQNRPNQQNKQHQQNRNPNQNRNFKNNSNAGGDSNRAQGQQNQNQNPNQQRSESGQRNFNKNKKRFNKNKPNNNPNQGGGNNSSSNKPSGQN